MSGLDPVAALASQVVANAENAIQVATLNLGVSGDVLQAQISVGDLIGATVLPAQNGSDYIALLGQTVAAQLPPGIDPGQSLLLQVTGFAGSQILVRNLGTIDPENPPATIQVQLPAPSAQSASPAPQTPVLAAQNASPTLAPPREIFVAAAVRPNAAAQPTLSASNAAAPLPDGELELRLAVNRTGIPLRAPVQTPSVPPAAAQARASVDLPVPSPTPPPPGLLNTAQVPVRSAAQAAAQLTPQAALLAKLRVPLSAATLIAARLVDDAGRAVTTSYERLDSVLGRMNVSDPRVASLRSLLTFVGKMDLRNTAALPEQIAGFVSHVVDGAESKVAQIVRALTTVAQEALAQAEPAVQAEQIPSDAAPPAFATPAAQSNASVQLPNVSQSPQQLPPSVAALVTERIVALEYNVKAAILSLVQNPPREFTPEVTQALSSALGATTAMQLNVLSAQNSDSSAIAIPLPAYFYDGGKPAQLRIERDAPGGGKAMDADNFHVSFVLDTKTMGTVAIDLQTAGRAVSVNVKTERASAADRFRDTLSDLRGRLEQLRYRVASMGAAVAPTAGAAARPSGAAPSQPGASKNNLDLRA